MKWTCPRIPMLLGAAILLGACEERKESKGAKPGGADAPAAAAVEEVKKIGDAVDKAGAWADRLKDSKLFKDGERLAQETLEQSKAALAKMDIEPMKKQADGLIGAMRAGDFAAAEKAAAALDATLQSKVLQRTVAVVKAKTEQGNEAAQALIDGYVKLPELGPEEKRFFEGLKEKIVNSSADDRVNFVVIAAGIACQIGLKGNGGELPFLVMELLFGKEYGVLRDKYEWRNPMEK